MVAPAVPMPAAPGGTTPPPGEGCPPPLAWQEVLESFRSGRDEYALGTSWGDVRLWEFGNGRPLCCLGGAAGDAELFALMAWLLRDQYRCLFVMWPDPPRQIPVAEWIPGWAQLGLDVLASRGYDALAWLGLGFGSVVALQAALEAPERVSHLVLQGCLPRRNWRLRERLLLACGSRSNVSLGRWPLWNGVVESNHRRWFPPFDTNRWEFLRDNLSATPTRRFADCMRAWHRPVVSDQLQAIAQPVLLVRTEGEGAETTAAQEVLTGQLPSARVEWMHSTGHFPHVTHPHRLAKLVREFLDPPAAAE